MSTILGQGCLPSDCEGERGERGKRGKRGHRGHDGHDGRDGDTGPTGPAGPTGMTGPAGPDDVGPFLFSPSSWFMVTPIADINVDENGSFWRSVIASGAKYTTLDLTPFLTPGDLIDSFVARWANGVTPVPGGTVQFVLARMPFSSTVQTIVTDSGLLTTDTGGPIVVRTQSFAVGHVVLPDTFYGLSFDMNTIAGNDQAGFGGISLVLG